MATGKRNKRRVEERQAEALGRQDYRNKLSPQQQLQALDDRLGTGVGAKKERARLEKQIEQSKKKVKEAVKDHNKKAKENRKRKRKDKELRDKVIK